jgi:uncharacterized DUF497 family protein
MEAFEWGETKAALNLKKHGISFDDAANALLGVELRIETNYRGRGARSFGLQL